MAVPVTEETPPPQPVHETTVRAPAAVTFQPVELMATESRLDESPILMASASALVPMFIVSQAAELQMEAVVALVLPKVKVPAVDLSKSLA